MTVSLKDFKIFNVSQMNSLYLNEKWNFLKIYHQYIINYE